ncbi:MAG: phage major capsid protein, partial [Pseudomonadota bacterium]
EIEEKDLRKLITLNEGMESNDPGNDPELRNLPGRGDVDPGGSNATRDPAEQEELAKRAQDQAFSDYLRYGVTNNPNLRAAMPLPQHLREAAFGAEQRGTNPQTTQTDSLGGFLVGESWANQVVSAMKAFGGILGVAEVITTASGDTMNYPTEDGTNDKGRIIAENAANVVSDMSLGNTQIGAFMYTSDVIKLPLQLLMDSLYDADGLAARRCGTRIGRASAEHFAVGDGSAAPQGLVPAAGAGPTTAAPTAIAHTDMLALKHSVNRAYRGNARWGFADSTLLALKSITDQTGLPLWNPNIDGAEASSYDGDRYFLDDDIPDLATTGNRCVLYGDFSYYIIRMVRDITLFRYNELFMQNHQIGIQAYARMDAQFVDAGGGAVKALIAG